VLEDIDFSFLKVIEELTLSYNDSLAQVDLSSLIAVNKAWWGRLEITNNPVLETIDLSMLQTVTYILRIAHNDLLLSIDLPAFTTGEASVTIDRNYLMTTFTTGATHLGSLSFYDTPVYTFSAPNLESISRDLVIAYCTFSSLSLDSLTIVGEDLSFYLNQSLTALSLPLLTTVGETFSIWGNRLLSCDYGTYQAQVTATLPFDVCDNGPLDACGPDTCP
jgi:hypothetical protein